MPFVKYNQALKAEAIALAEVLGLSAAAAQLGVAEPTIRDWMLRAGRRPADSIEPASWERLARLAMTKAERLVAEGKLSAAQLINAATMAESRAAAQPRPDERTADDDLLAWIDQRYPTPHERKQARHVTEAVMVWSLRTVDVPPGLDSDEPNADTGAWVSAALGRILEGTADLDAMAERFTEAARRYDERQRVIAKRATVLSQSGMAYYAAREMAAEITDDYPMPDLSGLLLEMPT